MILVFGLGFVGLTTALGFANRGFKVTGFDIDAEKVRTLNSGTVPFYEPGLEAILRKNLNKNLLIADRLTEAMKQARYVFFCVGTPNKPDGSCDLSFLKSAVKEYLRGTNGTKQYTVLIIKSTVPPSTTLREIAPLIRKYAKMHGRSIGLAYNPEFLREGCAWRDFNIPDRIIIGSYDAKSGRSAEKLFKAFSVPIFHISLNAAEFVKYLSNTVLSSLISFSNEMYMIADKIGGIDIPKVFRLMHADRRWNGHPAGMTLYAFPGCGFGGYCLPKDTAALRTMAKRMGIKPLMLDSVLATNKKIKLHIVSRILKAAKKNQCIGILGLSFKPNCDDVRSAVSKDVIRYLLNRGYKNIIAYDPLATEKFRNEYKFPITYANNLEYAVKRSKVLVILTACPEFKKSAHILKKRKIIDGRFCLNL